MENRPVRSLEEARIYDDQLNRIRYQLQLLTEDYEKTSGIFERASLNTDIKRLRAVEEALLSSINTYMVSIGRSPIT